MDLYLTDEEQHQLEELGARFEYAQLLWNFAFPGGSANHFTVEHHDALEWKYESRGVFPKARGTLRRKLDSFYTRIS